MSIMTSPLRSEFCTVSEAAGVIGVHHSQVTRYIKSGLLSAERVGNQLFVLRAEVESFERPRPGNRNSRKSEKSSS